LSSASPQLKKYLNPKNDIFPLLKDPKPGDWLYGVKETPQTFLHYKRMYHKKKLKNQLKKGKIYLLPIGLWDYPLEILCELLNRYYYMETVVTPAMEIVETSDNIVKLVLKNYEFTIECEKTDKTFQTKDLRHMLKSLLKSEYTDASFLVALTDKAITSDDGELFGEADSHRFVCTIGLHRFKHESYDKLLWYTSSTIVHEIGHLFGLDHCVYYECVMEGTNTFDEFDRQPLYLCPVCLHKMCHAMNFDVMRRYVGLLEFYSKHECFRKEKEWVERRLEQIKGMET